MTRLNPPRPNPEPTIKNFFIILTSAVTAVLPFPNVLLAQEDEVHFKAVDMKGEVTIYRDETNETSRFHLNQFTEEGDRITTGPHSDAVLKFKGNAYIYLSPNTKVRITRFHSNDGHLQCQINLMSGRLTAQLDQAPGFSLEVSTKNLLCRAHGTLFEVFRKMETVYLTSFEGAVVVTDPHGKAQMAKSGQVVKYEDGRFRFRHYLRAEQETRLKDWKDRLQGMLDKQAPPKS
jgi:hypothetical protein